MPKALPLNKPGNSLAVWLAVHHPDLFVAAFKQAKAQQVATRAKAAGLRGLADDDVTTSFAEPALQEISVNADFDTSNLLSDSTPAGSSFLDSITTGLTSAGSSLGGAVTGAGSSILGALGSVGTYLTSPTGLTSLTNLAKTYYAAQGAQATAQTQQAVLQAQIGRAAAGQTAAPITYTTGANGLPVAVYATKTPQGYVYQPLSQQGIQSLTPSGFSQFVGKYGLYIGLGVALLVGLTLLRR